MADALDRLSRQELIALVREQARVIARLEALNEWRVIQQVELATKLYTVTEHRARRYRCKKTGRIITASLPRALVKAGLVGPRLTALAAYLKGACHSSYTTVQTFFNDVLKVRLSAGPLAKLVRKTGDALKPAYDQLKAALPRQAHLGVDETGHKEGGRAMWTWCFRADDFVLFKIDASRSSRVLTDTLGAEFAGVLSCDYFSAYRKYLRDSHATVQFCLAHLIRDVKYLTTLVDRVTRRYGEKVLKKLKALFRAWHRRETIKPRALERALHRARDGLLKAARRPPPRAEARRIAERFRAHGASYFRFITTDIAGVEPTNNRTERAIRFVVIDRKVTQGTRSGAGRRWCERIWTVMATCAQQGRSAFTFLADSLQAHHARRPTPALLP